MDSEDRSEIGTKMKICILHIGHHDPNEKTKHPPSPQRFRDALSPYLVDAKWTVISAVEDTLPEATTFDAYLITGGKYSVFDEYDWQNRLFDFIRELDQRRIPLIGVCYGHQAIAHALGGKVVRSERGWGVGLTPVDVVGDVVWSGIQSGLRLHAMHQDQVLEMPKGGKLSLSSEFCPISGFTMGDHFFAIQQHPDFTKELNQDLIVKRRENMGAAAEIGISSLSGRDDTETAVVWMARFLKNAVNNSKVA